MDLKGQKDIFYYDASRMSKFNLFQAVLVGFFSILVFVLYRLNGDHGIHVIAMVLLGLSLLFFIQAIMALIFRHIPLMEIGLSEVAIYSGMIGFRRKLVIPMDALEGLSIETIVVNNQFKSILKDTGSVEVPALVLKLREPETSGVGRFCSTAVFDFACSDDRRKIILKIPPKGGFEQVIAALSERKS